MLSSLKGDEFLETFFGKKLLVLVGFLFPFLALSTHKHPGNFKKEKKPFLDSDAQRGLRVCHHESERDVQFSKTIC